MKIRSLDELNDYLSKELAPRKQELTTLKLRMLEARNYEKLMLLRAGFVMIYAHFEGFIRSASTAYLSYVSHQGLSFEVLSPNFVAVGLKSQLENLGSAGKASVVNATVRCFLEGMTDTAPFSWLGEVDARNNLKRDVLIEIFSLTGLDMSPYETKWAFVDEVLVENRNSIAHGKMTRIEEKTYLEAHQQTIEMIEQFKIDVENAAVTNRYKRN